MENEPEVADEEYLAPGDVARLLCVSPRTVSRWAAQGRIPHLVTLGGHRRFRRSDIDSLVGLAQRSQGTVVPPAVPDRPRTGRAARPAQTGGRRR